MFRKTILAAEITENPFSGPKGTGYSAPHKHHSWRGEGEGVKNLQLWQFLGPLWLTAKPKDMFKLLQ